ncbi:MAG TPA: helix-turn-helix transcriptional regulator [Noviherbaspirillum sp.]|nr:helix-turn-helix transcriptional regulator [Noviherbaspirillum sp.]
MEVNRRYFESLMADRNLTLRGLAKKMDMGHSQLSLTFSGARKLTIEEAAKLSQIFGEPLYKIVENAGVIVRPVAGRRVSVVGVLTGDGSVKMHGAEVIERTTAIEELPEDTIAVQARTAGTPLAWMDSWLFFCREPRGLDPASTGRFCLIRLKDGTAGLGTLSRGYVEGTWNVSGPFQSENVAVESATPVLLTKN